MVLAQRANQRLDMYIRYIMPYVSELASKVGWFWFIIFSLTNSVSIWYICSFFYRDELGLFRKPFSRTITSFVLLSALPLEKAAKKKKSKFKFISYNIQLLTTTNVDTVIYTLVFSLNVRLYMHFIFFSG